MQDQKHVLAVGSLEHWKKMWVGRGKSSEQIETERQRQLKRIASRDFEQTQTSRDNLEQNQQNSEDLQYNNNTGGGGGTSSSIVRGTSSTFNKIDQQNSCDQQEDNSCVRQSSLKRKESLEEIESKRRKFDDEKDQQYNLAEKNVLEKSKSSVSPSSNINSSKNILVHSMSKEEKHAKQQADLEAFFASLDGGGTGDILDKDSSSSDISKNDQKNPTSSTNKVTTTTSSKGKGKGGKRKKTISTESSSLSSSPGSSIIKKNHHAEVKKDDGKKIDKKTKNKGKEEDSAVLNKGKEEDADLFKEQETKKQKRERRNPEDKLMLSKEVVVLGLKFRVEAELRKSYVYYYNHFIFDIVLNLSIK